MNYSLKHGLLALGLIAVLVTPVRANVLLEMFGFPDEESNKPAVELVATKWYSEADVKCLAQNVYHEAGGEDLTGKIAVAQVSLNRLNDPRYPKSVCGVVQQKTNLAGTVVCQFSWYCTSKKFVAPAMSDVYQDSLRVAKMVLDGVKLEQLKSALYFHSVKVNPEWKKVKVAQIGNHVFYKDYRR